MFDNYNDTLSSKGADTGADISAFNSQVLKERSTRSLTLRRTPRPTIAGLSGNRRGNMIPRVKLFDTTDYPFLEPGYAAQVFSECNVGPIRQLCHNITTVYDATPKLVLNVIQSEDISEPMINFLSETSEEIAVNEVLNFIGTIYPKCGSNQEKIIDDGLTFAILNFLQSDNINIIPATINCINNISQASSYARDSILCMDVHSELIRIASTETSPEITQLCCKTLHTIFSNQEEIDTNIISICLGAITNLLNLSDILSVDYVLKTLEAMTQQHGNIIMQLFQMDISTKLIPFLSIDDLVESTLDLITNLCSSNLNDINQLLENGLMDSLFGLLSIGHIAHVYKVLAELVESRINSIMHLFDQAFIEQTIELSNDGDYEVKKSTTYFLATLIIFTPMTDLSFFLCNEVADMIESMLGCGHLLIVLRCLDALIKIVKYVANADVTTEFMDMISTDDMRCLLSNIMNSGSEMATERAIFLLDILSSDLTA